MIKIFEALSLVRPFAPYMIYPLLMVAAWAIIRDRKIRISVLFAMATIPVAIGFNTYTKIQNIDKLSSNLIRSCTLGDAKDQIFKTVHDVEGVNVETNRRRTPNDPYLAAENYLNPGEWSTLFLGGPDGYSYVEENFYDNKKFQSYEIINREIKRSNYEGRRSAINVKWELIEEQNKIKQFDLVIVSSTTGEEVGRKPVFLAEVEPIFFPMTLIQMSPATVLSCPRQSSLVHFIKQVAVPSKKDGGLKL